jgi:hypothetical protein
VVNIDNDGAGIIVSNISGNTTEAGGTATFTVVLASAPSSSVSIGLTSSDTTEGTISAASLSFTTSNWATPQTVTVTGVNDNLDDGNVAFSITTANASGGGGGPGGYNVMSVADVPVINTDDDTAGFTVSAVSGNTSEAGTNASFTIRLNSQPTANVMVGLTSSDTTEGTVSPASLTFTTSNWATPQTVNITRVDDSIDDGDIAYSIITAPASSSDGTYNLLNPANVSLTNIDNDSAGFNISTISGNTTESGGSAT